MDSALRAFLVVHPPDIALALVGGLAVTARTGAPSTNAIEIQLALSPDRAEDYLASLSGFDVTSRVSFVPAGYSLIDIEEERAPQSLLQATVQQPGTGAPLTLTFADDEIIAGATPLAGVPVASIGDLIAMKLQNQKPPLNRTDLVSLAKAATDVDWDRAASTIHAIKARGGAPGMNLLAALKVLRANAT